VGDFIAKENIPWGGVLAYTRGQRVEADAVKANGWEDLVVGEDTKEAREIKAEITGHPVEAFATTPAKATTSSSRTAAGTEKQEG
jgi:hypothetical protein